MSDVDEMHILSHAVSVVAIVYVDFLDHLTINLICVIAESEKHEIKCIPNTRQLSEPYVEGHKFGETYNSQEQQNDAFHRKRSRHCP